MLSLSYDSRGPMDPEHTAQYCVILFNDQVHKMDEVVAWLVNATGLDIQRCIEITWRAHVEGRAVVARAQQAEAEHIAEILHQGGLIAAVHPCEHTS